MQRLRSSLLITIPWIALLLSLWTTADRVVDLVFEEPDLTVTAPATAEEPDNAAEHLLIPSERVAGTATDTLLVSTIMALVLMGLALIPSLDWAFQAAVPPHRARSRPVSFSVPLRI